MWEWIEKQLEKFAAVKQGSGVVGKLCTLGYFVFVAVIVCLWNMSGKDAQVAELMLTAIKWIIGAYLAFAVMSLLFAVCNPLAANMESGDHAQAHSKQLEVAQKGQAASVPTANVPAPQVEVVQIPPAQGERGDVAPQGEQGNVAKEPTR